MSSINNPPIFTPVVENDGKSSIPWALFFNQLFEGDTGTAWTPTFQGLTVVTPPTISARYYRISRRICLFRVTLGTPTNTSATAGTTYIDNFPLTITNDGFCIAVSGNLGGNAGHVVASTNRIYVPAWTTVTVPLTIVGFCEVQS